VGSADQGDVSGTVLDEVVAGHPVGVLGLQAPQGSVVDGHRFHAVGAMLGSHDPGVADDGAAAPGPTAVPAEAQAHDVGHLALVGRVTHGDATLDRGLAHGHILPEDWLLERRYGGNHAEEQDR